MALDTYNKKRDFTRTPEPKGATARKRGNSFVIQKHDATRLHYDFRLEMDGVLKSWAVTRGPSLVPSEKRLAVHVEDHPLDYGDFEGVIPHGEYGGGTVMLWDRGRWEPVGDPHEGYAQGKLKFVLHGERLHGGWTLVRMGGKAAREKRENWLLIKERDDAARPDEGTALLEQQDFSVATRRTMDQIASDRDRVHRSKGAEAAARRPAAERPAIPGAKPGPLPDFVTPQQPTRVAAPPKGDDWLHEIKFDGYRLLAR